MTNLQISFFILIFGLIPFWMSAQCPGSPPLSFTYESTESRCESNGTITLHITGGTPFTDNNGNPIYNNTIIAPIIIPVGGQADSIFAALAADTYTVEVVDANGCTATATITVPGTHQQLMLTPTYGDATCGGGGGGWICGKPAKGRPWPPGYYKYQLFDNTTTPPTPITSIGLDSCFFDLAAGDYQIRAFDSCNNFQSRDIVLQTKPYASTLRNGFNWRYYNCDTSCMWIYPRPPTNDPWGEFPFHWEVINVPPSVSGLQGQSGDWEYFNDRDTICWSPMFPGELIDIKVTDACGKTTTLTYNLPPFTAYGTRGYNCQTGTYIQIYENPMYYCPKGSVLFEAYQTNPGNTLPPPQDSGLFVNLQNGFYRIRVTDCCGNMDTYYTTVSAPVWTAVFDVTSIETCVPGEVGFKTDHFASGGAPTNPAYELISAPPGYPGPIPDTLGHRVVVNGPPGEYCVVLTDDCMLRTDTLCQMVTDTLVYKPDRELIPECITGNVIISHDETNIDYRYYIYRIAPGNPVTIDQNSKDTIWYNLTAGTYRFRTYNAEAACWFGDDTIVVPEYIQPSIVGSWGIECDDGVGLITVIGSGGTLPYLYELYQGPITRPLQSSPDFPGLPLGTYDIRLYDLCGNSEITTQAIEPFQPVIQGYGGYFCEGDTAVLFTDYFNLATYSWSGPNGQTSDTSVLMIPNITMADAGTYTIDIDVKNPDQTACIAQTLTIDIEVFDCACSIDQISSTDVSCSASDDGTASVLMDGGAPPFSYNWNNGESTAVISNLPAGVYTVTVTDVRGCVVVDMVTINQSAAMSVVPIGTTPECANVYNGTLNVFVSGGTSPYSYLWSTGATTQTVGGIGAGAFTVTVTDAVNCSSFNTVTLSEPDPLLAVVSVANAACPTSTDGSATVAATGGTPGYSYQWDAAAGGQTTSTVTGLMAGTYQVTILDDNICEYTVAVTIGSDEPECLDECPDLTPIITILPGNIAGVSAVGIAIEVTELNGFDTDGSLIIVRVPSDPRLTFVWDPGLTSVALTTVNNANWNYLGDNGFVHTFQYNGPNGVILASSVEAFGMEATYDPQATDGQTTITSTIIPFSGGECNILNNTDSERLVYFE